MPTTFEGVRDRIPAGHSLSERLLEPIILLDRKDDQVLASLGGIRTIRGLRNEFRAPTDDHAWVVDGTVLRPLPKDAPDLFRNMLGDVDPGDLPFSVAIRLLRTVDERMSTVASATVLIAGRDAADRETNPVAPRGLRADLFPYQARGVQWM
jgi:hypothetical protein